MLGASLRPAHFLVTAQYQRNISAIPAQSWGNLEARTARFLVAGVLSPRLLLVCASFFRGHNFSAALAAAYLSPTACLWRCIAGAACVERPLFKGCGATIGPRDCAGTRRRLTPQNLRQWERLPLCLTAGICSRAFGHFSALTLKKGRGANTARECSVSQHGGDTAEIYILPQKDKLKCEVFHSQCDQGEKRSRVDGTFPA